MLNNLVSFRFDDGDEVLSEFLGMLDLPVTSYNLKPGADSPLLDAENLVKYYVKTFDNGDKVGFCGMTPKMKVESHLSPIQVPPFRTRPKPRLSVSPIWKPRESTRSSLFRTLESK